MGKTQKRKVFFSEEKKQKTFIVLSRSRRQRTPSVKSFLVLFFKKEQPSLERLSKPGMASQMAFVFEHRSGAAVWGP
jgi:hypothetical protein